ncbi:hypothetical protein VTI74DRAFT_4719 [Chaetomium olivicolor]
MFAVRSHVRTTSFSGARRCYASVAARPPNLRTASNEVARKLRDEGKFADFRSRKGKNQDRYRVNIVSEQLCDDVINYIKPTLARHEGCDLVDIFPGAGVWSSALNKALSPRSHLLLEPDEEFYKPFLAPLLEKPGTRLVPESGIVWEQLHKVLNPSLLPHQVERKYSPDETVPRNDTLLVTLNLSMYPKRKFRTFDSLTQLVLFQLIASIRPGALFQKYGLVRLLIWLADHEKSAVVPRTVQRRKKMAVETELATEYICEIAGSDTAESLSSQHTSLYRRDQALDLESMELAAQRMKQAGYAIPEGREPEHVVEYGALDRSKLPNRLKLDRPNIAEYERLKAASEAGHIVKGMPEFERYKTLRHWMSWHKKRGGNIEEMLRERDAAVRAYVEAGSDEAALARALEAGAAWGDKLDSLEDSIRSEVLLHRDNMHVLRQDRPVLSWDRRYVEPLRVRPHEFFPQVPCALLDIQPKSAARVLRDMGPRSTRGGDNFDLILKGLMQHSVDPVYKALNRIYSGADGIIPYCRSLIDPALGGSPLSGSGALSSRSLAEHQLVDIAEAWMKWPFKPAYSDLVSRTVEDMDDDFSDDPTGNIGTHDGSL